MAEKPTSANPRQQRLVAMRPKADSLCSLRVLRVLTLRVISRQRGNLALLGVKRTSCGSLGLQVLPFENVVAPGSIRTHGCAELVQI